MPTARSELTKKKNGRRMYEKYSTDSPLYFLAIGDAETLAVITISNVRRKQSLFATNFSQIFFFSPPLLPSDHSVDGNYTSGLRNELLHFRRARCQEGKKRELTNADLIFFRSR